MANYRNTKQRKAILAILKNASNPLSANEIYEKAKKIYPSIALTTIYRNLDHLADADLLCKHRLNKNEYSYALNDSKHHHYIVCLSCSRTVSIDKCPLEGLEDKVRQATGYQVVSHDIQLYGYCNQCNAKEKKKNK